MIFNYPYTDLYTLNLDWIIKAVKEVQNAITGLGTIVNSVNGQTGDVVITKEFIETALGAVVNSLNGKTGDVVLTKEDILQLIGSAVETFNGRSGNVVLTAADVNKTAIETTYVSDAGDIITDFTPAELRDMYDTGKRIMVLINNLGVPDRLYLLVPVGDAIEAQPYTPTSAQSGVLSINGMSGAVSLQADDIPISTDPDDNVENVLDTLQTEVYDLQTGKQNRLTFDQTPQLNSQNPVVSGGVYAEDAAIKISLQETAVRTGVLAVTIPSISALPVTIQDTAITDDMVCIKAVLGVPSVQTGDWTVTTATGSVTLSGAMTGTTAGTLYLANQKD